MHEDAEGCAEDAEGTAEDTEIAHRTQRGRRHYLCVLFVSAATNLRVLVQPPRPLLLEEEVFNVVVENTERATEECAAGLNATTPSHLHADWRRRICAVELLLEAERLS